MPPTRTPMSPTLIAAERVRMLSLQQAGCQPLREAGVRFLGVDVRPPKRAWGEGLSRTVLLYWVVEGQVRLEDGSLGASAGTCLIIPPLVPKRLATDAEALRAVWIHLEWRRPWTRWGTTTRVVPAARGPRLWEWLQALEDESAGGSPALMQHLARAVVGACQDLGRDLPVPVIDPWQALWEEVAAHPQHPWTSAGLARRAGLSRAQFHRRVLAQHGITPMERVRRLRLERAVLLLQTTERTTEDIAAEVGYSSGFALSHALHRQQGRRPSHLR